jgi:hypothetical protein
MLSGVTEMHVKVLILALVAALVALPVSAGQWLTGTFSAPAHPVAAAAPGAFGTLIQDPFLAAHLSFTPARSVADAT